MSPKKKTKNHETTENQVLKFLETKSASKWEMTKVLNKTYSNIHTVVNRLMKRKFIEISKTEPSSKNPKIKVEYYDLTLPGLIWTLGIPERTFDNIDEIASYHKDKLLVFQEWNSFKREGVDKDIIKYFKRTSVREYPTSEESYMHIMLEVDIAREIPNNEMKKKFDLEILRIHEFLFFNELEAIIEICGRILDVVAKNDKLRTFVLSDIKSIYSEYLDDLRKASETYKYCMKKLGVSNLKPIKIDAYEPQ